MAYLRLAYACCFLVTVFLSASAMARVSTGVSNAVPSAPSPSPTPAPAPKTTSATTQSSLGTLPTAPIVKSPAPAPTVVPLKYPTGSAGYPTAGPQESMNPSANKGQKSQSNGAMINAIASAALMAACMATTPPNMALCMMGGLAAMQAGKDDEAAGESGNTGGATVAYKPPLNNGGVQPAAEVVPLAGGATPAQGTTGYKIASGQKALADAGYKVTEDGVTDPSGKFTPASAFSSPSSMAAAGMSASTIKDAQKALADANKQYSNLPNVGSLAVNEGGGGVATASESGGDSEAYGRGSRAYTNPFALNNAQRQQMVAGKTVLFDGEPIGVRGQDLFNMVHVAYEKKRTGNHFMETASRGAPVVRAPANVKKLK